MDTRQSEWLNKIKCHPDIDIGQTAISSQWIAFISTVLEPTGRYNKKDCARLKNELPQGYCCGYSALKGYAEEISKQSVRYYCDLFYLSSFHQADVIPAFSNTTNIVYVVNKNSELFEINCAEHTCKQVKANEVQVKALCAVADKLNVAEHYEQRRSLPLEHLSNILLQDQITSLMSHAAILPSYDKEWFYRMLYTLATWNQDPATLSQRDKNDLEEFLAQLNYFQNIEYYSFDIGQANLQHNLFDSRGRKVEKEYSLGALFTQEQLIKLLDENLLHEDTIIILQNQTHVMNLEKENEIYIFYNPNNTKGEIAIAENDNVLLSENIFHSFHFQKDKPSPVSFTMFRLVSPLDNPVAHSYPTKPDIYKKLNLSVNISSGSGYAHNVSPLMQACRVGDEESVIYLLQHGADINFQEESGFSALHYAVYFYHPHLVRLLLAKHANSLLKNNQGDTPLMMAIKESDISMVNILLNTDYPANIKIENHEKKIALTLAIENKRHDVVISLLLKADEKEFEHTVSLLDANMLIAILEALAYVDHPELAKLLLARLTDEQLNLLIKNSIKDKNFPLMKLICLNTKCMHELITTASKDGYLDTVIFLIDQVKMDINSKLPDATPLIYAARYGHLAIVNYLIKSGAKLDIEDEDGDTALTLAALNGYKEIVGQLLVAGANIEHKDNIGNTALLLAAVKGNKEVVELLLEHKANINIINEKGKSVLIASAWCEDKATFHFLRNQPGLDVYSALLKHINLFINHADSHYQNITLQSYQFIFSHLNQITVSHILQRALQEKQLPFLEFLLKTMKVKEDTLIYKLVYMSDMENISLLKKCGANVDVIFYDAVKLENREVVDGLIKMGIGIEGALCIAASKGEVNTITRLVEYAKQPMHYILWVGLKSKYLPLIEAAMKILAPDDIYKVFLMINDNEETSKNKHLLIQSLFDNRPANFTISMFYHAVQDGKGSYLETVFQSLPYLNKKYMYYHLICKSIEQADKAVLLKLNAIENFHIDFQGPNGDTALIYLLKNKATSERIDLLLINNASVSITNHHKESPYSIAIHLFKENKLSIDVYLKIEKLMLIENYLKEKEIARQAGAFTAPAFFYPLKELPIIKDSFEHTNEKKMQLAMTLRNRIANNASIALDTFSQSEQAALMQGNLKTLYHKICQKPSAAELLRMKK